MKNENYTVKIESYTSEGFGVCRIDGRAVFVPNTLKGEKWVIKLLKVTSGSVYAKGVECLKASPARQRPDCPYYAKCGGCHLQHMSYEEELQFKRERVNDALKHIGRQNVLAQSIIAADPVYRYRNKAIFNVSQIDGKASFGFFRERTHDLIAIDDCLIQQEAASKCAQAVIDFMNSSDLPAFNENTGKGTVRHIFCRKAVYTEDLVLCIISARGFGNKTQALCDSVLGKCPEITGIVLNINKERYNTVLAGEFYTLYGRPHMVDCLCGHSFSISPQAFYQVNPLQAEKLYNKALEYCIDCKNILELYCGAGTISLSLAKKCGNITAAEIVPEAIENAKINARNNHVENVTFICADAAEAAEKYRGKYDCVLVDPPRKGMDEAAVQSVAAIDAEKIVYISCNPSTLARDILRFNSYGYELKEATAVDMFPRTAHVETVVLLSKVNTPKG